MWLGEAVDRGCSERVSEGEEAGVVDLVDIRHRYIPFWLGI